MTININCNALFQEPTAKPTAKPVAMYNRSVYFVKIVVKISKNLLTICSFLYMCVICYIFIGVSSSARPYPCFEPREPANIKQIVNRYIGIYKSSMIYSMRSRYYIQVGTSYINLNGYA